MAIICGQETLTLADPSNEVFDIFINSTSKDSLKYSLAGLWTTTHPNSYVDSNEICGIDYFKVCSSIFCNDDKIESYLNIFGSFLRIDISKSISLNEFYITPVTTGG